MASDSIVEKREVRGGSILSGIEEHALRAPNQPAIIFEGRKYSFAELVASYRHISRYFRQLGLGEGCRVCILSKNAPEYLFVYFATLHRGGTLFPINYELTEREAEYIIARASPHLIVVGDSELPARKLFLEKFDGIDTRVLSMSALMNAQPELSDEPLSQDDPIARAPDSIALVVHTSGTTSAAKGVIATDGMEVASAKSLQEYWCISSKDISLCALPLSYTFGLFTASYAPLSAGATVLLLEKFHPVAVLEEIKKHRATMMVGVPTMFSMMVNAVRETGNSYDTRSIRLFAASGAPVPERTRTDFQKHLGHRLFDYYALSECTPIFSFDLRRPDLGAGFSGLLVEGARIRIVDESGNAVRKGEVGALRVASERLTAGYYKDEERTQQAIRDGWFETGDLVREREGGYYAIVGRTRDQIISGGHKIAAVEIENILLKHEDVAAAAVVAEADARLGEIVVAFVVIDPSSRVTGEQLLAFCREQLAPYKVPRKIVFRDSFPMSPAGKVLKREL